MRLIDAQFLETPWYGSRQMVRHLCREGHEVGCRATIWVKAASIRMHVVIALARV